MFCAEFTEYNNHHASNGEIWNNKIFYVWPIGEDDIIEGGIEQKSATKIYECNYFDRLDDIILMINKYGVSFDEIIFEEKETYMNDIKVLKEKCNVSLEHEEPEL